MPVTINGDGTITGLSVGGLPNGSVDADTLASNAVTTAKIASGAVATANLASGAVAASTLPAGSIVQTVLKNGTASGSLVQLNNGVMGNPAWFDTGLLSSITPIFSNSKILATAMFSIRIGDGNRLGVGIYAANNSNMTNLVRISEYRGSSGNECFRTSAGGSIWTTSTIIAVDDGSYSNDVGQFSMSTSVRYYNLGHYHASGDGAVYYGDNSQRVYLILQEVKQ
tara:strand:+ start:359 stop:1033 length:675 start_codon:yes stop_codon:yes gene_type:complete